MRWGGGRRRASASHRDPLPSSPGSARCTAGGERTWTQRVQWYRTGCASQLDLLKITRYLQMGNFVHMTYLLAASVSLSGNRFPIISL